MFALPDHGLKYMLLLGMITYSMPLSYLNLGRTYMFPETHHLSYIKIIYSIIIINNDHINILYYIMPYRVHS